jgi:hypothetical protein
MSAPLTARIPVKDQRGNVIEEKEVATYAGLLSRAHEEGLDRIDTSIVQFPTDENGFTCICLAVVHTSKGTFTGIGDANENNVNRRIVPHLIRMAETRAKARALRDAVNIGVVALEELGGEEPEAPVATTLPAASKVRQFPRPVERPEAQREVADPRRGDREPPGGRMTENQRRWLYRALADRGFEGEQATTALCRAAEVRNVGDITKSVASALIDAWKREEGQ